MSDWLSNLEEKKRLEERRKKTEQADIQAEKLRQKREKEKAVALFYENHGDKIKFIYEKSEELVFRAKKVLGDYQIHLHKHDFKQGEEIIWLLSQYESYGIEGMLRDNKRTLWVTILDKDRLNLRYQRPSYERKRSESLHYDYTINTTVNNVIQINDVNEETISSWVEMVATGKGFPEKETKTWSSDKPRCFIATAAFGSPIAEEVALLRAFRDKVLEKNKLGKISITFYYQISPPIARRIEKNNSLRSLVRLLLKPIVVLAKNKKLNKEN